MENSGSGADEKTLRREREEWENGKNFFPKREKREKGKNPFFPKREKREKGKTLLLLLLILLLKL